MMRLPLSGVLTLATSLLVLVAGARSQEIPYHSSSLLPLPQIQPAPYHAGMDATSRTPVVQDVRPFAQSAPYGAPAFRGEGVRGGAYPATYPATGYAPATYQSTSYGAAPTTASSGFYALAPAGRLLGNIAPVGAEVIYGERLSESGESVSLGSTGAYEEVLATGWGDDCISCNSCVPTVCPCTWFGGVYGLIMTRDRTNPVHKQLSFDDTDPAGQLLGTFDASMEYQGGVEVRFGRTLASGLYAWEVVYWGIFHDTEEANAFDPAGAAVLRTALDFANLQGNGAAGGLGNNSFVNNFYDNGQRHRLRRGHEIHNLELNLLRLPTYAAQVWGGRGGHVRVRGAVGLRYFRFDEDFEFAGDAVDTTFGSNNDEMFYSIDVENNLLGFQLGYLADYHVSRRFSLYVDTKYGLYGNHIRHHSLIANANGAAVVGPAALANVGRAFDIRSTKNDISFVGELRVGGSFQISPRWRATAGYRAVAVTGVALAANQIPAVFDDIDGVAQVESNGALILHGLQVGLELTY